MEPDHYPAGMPCWVDVESGDVDASIAFYRELFGWDDADAPSAGGYRVIRMRGKTVAGVRPDRNAAAPPLWRAYINTDDPDATIDRVHQAGGTVLTGFLDFGVGGVAICADDAGAVFGLWRPGTGHGAQLCVESNTFCWVELACRDVDAATRFYGTVFGWDSTTTPISGTTYTEFALGASPVAGMIEMTDQWPAGLPPHWMVYFTVDDCDRTTARLQQLGGGVTVPPTDIEPGRFAVVHDPQGNTFSVIAPRHAR